MLADDALSAALQYLWEEFGIDVLPEEQPVLFLTLRHFLDRAVEDRLRRLRPRGVADLYRVSPN